MMQLKKILSLVLAAAMALSMAACGAGSAASSQAVSSPAVSQADSAASEQAAASNAAETVYPVTLTDQAGREVTIEQEPESLVSSYYISTSLLIALGLDSKVVGVENKPGNRPVYALSAPELLDLPTVGTAKEFDLEGCAALAPDLVILPLKLRDAADSLAQLGITALVINPEDQDLLNEAITLIGTATNTQDRANALMDFAAAQEQRLTDALADTDKPTVYLGGNSSFLSTAGDAMYQSDLIQMAGGTNAAAEITDTYWAEVSYEQILAWNPDYIVLASDADYTVEDVLNDPNLAGCAAVENGRVYQIPGDVEAWDSPIPGGILGAVWLASVLHPDQCPEEETTAVINDFYETFYGFSYSEN